MSSPLQILKALLRADVPVLLWGPPGTAKTASLLQLAEDEGAHVEVLIGSTLDPSDVGGVPVPHQGKVDWSPPPWARRLREALNRGRKAWLVLDELSCSPAPVQAALLRVVQERRVGDVDLRGVRVVAAANPADSAADNGWLSPAMSNRFSHVTWAVPPTWARGLLNRWGLGWADGGRTASCLAAYLHAHPTAREGKASADGIGGYPTPRSWTSAVAAVAESGGVKSPVARAVVAACVGPAAADEWMGWIATQDLPDPEEILAGKAELPKRADQVRASLLAVVAVVLQDRPDQNARVARAWEILGGVRPDVAVVAATALLEGAPDAPLPTQLDVLVETIKTARSRAGL